MAGPLEALGQRADAVASREKKLTCANGQERASSPSHRGQENSGRSRPPQHLCPEAANASIVILTTPLDLQPDSPFGVSWLFLHEREIAGSRRRELESCSGLLPDPNDAPCRVMRVRSSPRRKSASSVARRTSSQKVTPPRRETRGRSSTPPPPLSGGAEGLNSHFDYAMGPPNGPNPLVSLAFSSLG